MRNSSMMVTPPSDHQYLCVAREQALFIAPARASAPTDKAV